MPVVWTLDFSFPSFLISNSSNFCESVSLAIAQIVGDDLFLEDVQGLQRLNATSFLHPGEKDPRKTRPSFNDGNPQKRWAH